MMDVITDEFADDPREKQSGRNDTLAYSDEVLAQSFIDKHVADTALYGAMGAMADMGGSPVVSRRQARDLQPRSPALL